ncbi:MAG: FAD:protein FMN transferase [Acidimicrobiales bacterium]
MSEFAATRFSAIGTYVDVASTLGAPIDELAAFAREEIGVLDKVASCFRSDSEVRTLFRSTRVQRPARQEYEVSSELFELLSFALWAAEITGGLVDPTIGGALARLKLYPVDADPTRAVLRRADLVPGYRSITLDSSKRTAVLPRGVLLDFHSIAKGLWADRIARRLFERFRLDVLVGLGGDVGIAAPHGTSFPIAVPLSGSSEYAAGDPVIALDRGGIATSSTRWRTFDVEILGEEGKGLTHIVDPSTAYPVHSSVESVSVVAPSAGVANVFSLATIVGGDRGLGLLEESGYAARVTTKHGDVSYFSSWSRELSPVGGVR